MTIEIALLVSIVSVAFAVYFGVKNTKRADTSDAEKKATEMATINVKLDTIGGDVRDIKYDISAVKKDVQGLAERMVVVEQSTKSAHHRLDTLTEKEREAS
ncbi:MAG: hypothetical protein PHR92_10175 [Lachnospiraceae bacterium]|nr:hypothetical protein [Lachnospiraceae bacterium]